MPGAFALAPEHTRHCHERSLDGLGERKVNILLADDQPEVRSALRLLLGEEQDLSVVGEAADVAGLTGETQTRRPEIVLLDWELPGLSGRFCCREASGRRLIEQLRTACPGLKVIALSGRLEARDEALAAGADAFISKVESPECLLSTLRGMQDGFDE